MSKFKISFIVVAFLIIGNLIYACNPEPGVQHFPGVPQPQPPTISNGVFEVHSTLTGLPTNKILSIKMFKHKVYVGTADKGLLIYDGRSWKILNPNSKPVFPSWTVPSLAVKNNNSIIAGTPLGLVSIKNENNKYICNNLQIKSDDNLNVTDIAFSNGNSGNILVTCARKAGYIGTNEFQPYLLDSQVFAPPGFSCVACDGSKIYYGSDQGLFNVKSNRLEKCDYNTDLGWVNDIAIFKKQCFIGSSNGTYQLIHKKIKAILPDIWTTCLAINAKPELEKELPVKPTIQISKIGEMASEGYKRAVSERNQLLQDFQDYRMRARISPPTSDEVQAMWQRFAQISQRYQGVRINTPLEKGLWIGTHDQGVILMSKKGTKYHLTYDSSKLPSDNVTAIDCSKTGETWIGTANAGLLHYFKRTRTLCPKLHKLLACKPTRIKIIGGQLVIGTKKHGMYFYDLHSKEMVRHLISKDEFQFHSLVTDFALDSNGVMWITGDLGLIRLDNDNCKIIGFSQEYVPGDIPERVTVDKYGKLFVAFSNNSQMSSQLYLYNGVGLENISKKKIKTILSLPTKERNEYMKFLGLSDTYQRHFDLQTASETLKLFDTTNGSPISALINIPNYLLIGTTSGIQNIFDGESFKPLSIKGTGNNGKILNFRILPDKHILIQAVDAITIFDGRNYKEVLPVGISAKMTDICPDARNPATFWVSYTGNGTPGGIALYEKPYWSLTKLDRPIYSLAIDASYAYVASDDGVYYLAP